MFDKDISVVIGFRDWGAQRIRMAVKSIQESFGSYDGEVIISDYGSIDRSSVELVAQETGAKYIYTAGDPVWSRSRALNAGFTVAEGKILVSTDADMLFSPESFSTIVEMIQSQKNVALFLQCRDLPERMSAEALADTRINWRELELAGRLRPRWGMGGMMAIHRDGMNAIRGFDERLHTYGGEDLDFAQRARRAGYKTVWIDDERVRMYHMWHPATRATVDQTAEGRAAVAYNREVVYNDKTTVRNILDWRKPLPDKKPLVTVSIVTYNRAELIGETIKSVLMQSVQDFEIVIIDDGSQDETQQVIEAFNDSRIRYIWQENSGISVARNKAISLAQGRFIAVQDDDDLMHPRRLEWQLNAMTEDVSGVVGSFINFSDITGETRLAVSQKPSIDQLMKQGGAPGHGTWLFRTEVFRALPYDEKLTSGVDHNLFVRALRSGVKVVHCEKPVMLRRQHAKQVTVTDGVAQGDSAAQSLRFLKYNLNEDQLNKKETKKIQSFYPRIEDPVAYEREATVFLPDHLVTRNASIRFKDGEANLPKLTDFEGKATAALIRASDTQIPSYKYRVSGATYNDLVLMGQKGYDLQAEFSDSNDEDILDFLSLEYCRHAFANRFIGIEKSAVYTGDTETIQQHVEKLQNTEYRWMFFSYEARSTLLLEAEALAVLDKNPWLIFGMKAKDIF